MAKPDEVMAEYLLKGGKMLARDCKVCGCPLFEYKGETFCVACREAEQEPSGGTGKAGEQVAPVKETAPARGSGPSISSSAVRQSLESALVALCRRCEGEADPERCLVLMSAVRKGIEGLQLLDSA